MACEDFPCCGHEVGCCPNFVNGQQVNMRCTCGAVLPINNRYSICDSCLDTDDDEYNGPDYDEPDVDELAEHEDFERADEYYGHEDFGWDGGMED
jgi:hypothetical protein